MQKWGCAWVLGVRQEAGRLPEKLARVPEPLYRSLQGPSKALGRTEVSVQEESGLQGAVSKRMHVYIFGYVPRVPWDLFQGTLQQSPGIGSWTLLSRVSQTPSVP